MVKEIRISDFDYNLPEGRIPLHPLEKRDECKLLLHLSDGKIYHRIFKELPGLLPLGSLLVCNDTKVINARMLFHKETGAQIELFLLEPVNPSDYALNFQSRTHCIWKCLVGNSKKWKDGVIYANVPLAEGEFLQLQARRMKSNDDGSAKIEFFWTHRDITFGRIIDLTGKIPIPPYLNRESEDSDTEDYQTVYAKVKGSVAAPTAGLHFTPALFEAIDAHNMKVGKVTLHVGAGTFRPVKSEEIGGHDMHSEPFSVTRSLLKEILYRKKTGKPVIAVGTTTVRTLESLPYIGRSVMEGNKHPFVVKQWEAYDENSDFNTITALEALLSRMELNNEDIFHASTSIIIAPGFRWRVVTGMVTNFHQPKSTLLLLVSSFLGGDEWRRLYDEALTRNYRFLSYGDAMLLLNEKIFLP